MTHPKKEADRIMGPCGARTRRGKGPPCQKSRLLGGVRCRLHGGASPQALRKAEETLQEWRLRRVKQLDKGLDEVLKDRTGKRLARLIDQQPGLVARLLEVSDRLRGGSEKVALEGSNGGPIVVRQEDPLADAIAADPEARAAALRLLAAIAKKPGVAP